MKKISEMMTRSVQVADPDATLQEISTMMKDFDVGAIPVCDGGRLIGMVTDRDIAIRCVAENIDPKTLCARDIASTPIVYCFENQDVEDVARLMEVKQLRRLVVLDRNKRLVGIVSLGDIAVKMGSEELSGEILEKVSEPKPSNDSKSKVA